MEKKYFFTRMPIAAMVFAMAFAFGVPAKAFFLVYDGQTCNLNGVELPGPCTSYQSSQPATVEPMPPTQQYAQPAPMIEGNDIPQPVYQQPQEGMMQGTPSDGGGGYGAGPRMMESGQEFVGQEGQGDRMMGGPSEEQQKMDQERQLKDMKRGFRSQEQGIIQFEKMIVKAEKSGTVIPQEIKDKIAKVKSALEQIKNAASVEDMKNADVGSLQDDMQSLEEARRDIFEKAQRLQDIKRGTKGMEQGLKMFERQLATLAKQKVSVPQDIQDTIAKIKDLVSKIKNAKTFDELEEAGLEDMQDLFQKLDESRQQLEMLARWPKTLKQINQEITRLARELKRSKTLADKLAKKGIDVLSVYSEFESAVNKLKSVKDEAVNMMSAGQSEDAFNLIENDFFGQMDDVWEFQRVIQMMSNLGRFSSDFKQGINKAQNQIRMLKKEGVDTAELQDLLDQSKAKGAEILALIKASPIDEEGVMSGIQDLENLRQEFDDKMQELKGGQGEDMPWEMGPQQFKQVQMAPNVMKMIPQRQEAVPQIMPATMQGGPTTVQEIPQG